MVRRILSARVVLPGGALVEVAGEEVPSFVGPGATGIIVGAKLRTRQAHADVPFGAAFGSVDELTGAVAGVAEVGLPLWHLAFLNPGMAHARKLGENFLLFGAYPEEQAGEVEGCLQSVVGSSRGRTLSAVEAHRAWGEVLSGHTLCSTPTVSCPLPRFGLVGGLPSEA